MGLVGPGSVMQILVHQLPSIPIVWTAFSSQTNKYEVNPFFYKTCESIKFCALGVFNR